MAFRSESKYDEVNKKYQQGKIKFTKVYCSFCRGRSLTEKQLEYSKKYYNTPLCFGCQRYYDKS